jgi:hypothetical protein
VRSCTSGNPSVKPSLEEGEVVEKVRMNEPIDDEERPLSVLPALQKHALWANKSGHLGLYRSLSRICYVHVCVYERDSLFAVCRIHLLLGSVGRDAGDGEAALEERRQGKASMAQPLWGAAAG